MSHFEKDFPEINFWKIRQKILKTSPKGISASKYDVGNWLFSKSWELLGFLGNSFGNSLAIVNDCIYFQKSTGFLHSQSQLIVYVVQVSWFFGSFLGILWEFFGNSLWNSLGIRRGIFWEFFGNSLWNSLGMLWKFFGNCQQLFTILKIIRFLTFSKLPDCLHFQSQLTVYIVNVS